MKYFLLSYPIDVTLLFLIANKRLKISNLIGFESLFVIIYLMLQLTLIVYINEWI